MSPTQSRIAFPLLLMQTTTLRWLQIRPAWEGSKRALIFFAYALFDRCQYPQKSTDGLLTVTDRATARN